MPGYLEQYGAGEEKRERRLLQIAGGTLGIALLGSILYFSFRDWPLERKIKQFIEAVQHQDYKTAYTFWGCTAEAPCRDYAYDKFLEDWGPKGVNSRAAAAGKLVETERCGSGFIAEVGSGGADDVALWVEQSTRLVGYAPWRECPEKKLRLRKWLRMRFGIG